ncbi:hypothetical protein IAU60_003040 [Kwoniella sp. DSM 27419]
MGPSVPCASSDMVPSSPSSSRTGFYTGEGFDQLLSEGRLDECCRLYLSEWATGALNGQSMAEAAATKSRRERLYIELDDHAREAIAAPSRFMEFLVHEAPQSKQAQPWQFYRHFSLENTAVPWQAAVVLLLSLRLAILFDAPVQDQLNIISKAKEIQQDFPDRSYEAEWTFLCLIAAIKNGSFSDDSESVTGTKLESLKPVGQTSYAAGRQSNPASGNRKRLQVIEAFRKIHAGILERIHDVDLILGDLEQEEDHIYAGLLNFSIGHEILSQTGSHKLASGYLQAGFTAYKNGGLHGLCRTLVLKYPLHPAEGSYRQPLWSEHDNPISPPIEHLEKALSIYEEDISPENGQDGTASKDVEAISLLRASVALASEADPSALLCKLLDTLASAVDEYGRVSGSDSFYGDRPPEDFICLPIAPHGRIAGVVLLSSLSRFNRAANDEVRQFITLLATFTVIIALRTGANERLKHEIDQRTKDLQDALNNKTAFLSQCSHELRSPLSAVLVLLNLLSNAVKFTPQGRVAVKWRYEVFDGMVKCTLAVEDTVEMDKLFKSFSQVDSSVTRNHGGSGLGLIISKDLAKLLGGDCTVESEFGKGSTFYFTFVAERSNQEVVRWDAFKESNLTDIGCHPLRFEDDIEQCLIKGRDNGLNSGREFDFVLVDTTLVGKSVLAKMRKLQPKAKREQIVARPIKFSSLYRAMMDPMLSNDTTKGAKAPNQGKRLADSELGEKCPLDILLVDDNAINVSVGKRILELFGYSGVETASGGKQAVKAVEDRHFDVVLLDLQMPIVDGFTVQEQIRASAKAGDPCVAVQEKCIQAKFFRYLSKPMDIPKLGEILTAVYEEKQKRKKNGI